jgi:hypothetical protein
MRHWTNPPSCPNRAVNMDMGFVDYLCLRDRTLTGRVQMPRMGPLGLLLCSLATSQAFAADGGGACGRVRPIAGQRPADDLLCRKMTMRRGFGALNMGAGSPNTISAVSGVSVCRRALMLSCSSARPLSLAWCPLVGAQLPGTLQKEEQTPVNPLGASSRVLVVGASRQGRFCVCVPLAVRVSPLACLQPLAAPGVSAWSL